MANFDKIKLTNEIERLEDATREAYDDIFDKGNPGYNMQKYKTDTSNYKSAKAEYDKVYPSYLKLKADNDKKIAALKKQLDELTVTEDKEKNKKKTGGTLAEAKDEYQRALDSQDTERITAAKAALDAARVKYSEAKNPDATDSTGIESGSSNPSNPFANTDEYVLTANGAVSYKGNQVYLVTTPKDGVLGDVVTTPYNSITQARAAYVKAYASTPEQVAALKKQLVASDYATQQQVNSDTWYTKLDDAIVEYTTHVVNQAQFGGAKQPDLPTDFFKVKRAGAGGSGGGIQHTTRGTAKQAIDAYANDLVGSDATPEEVDAYYKELIKAETQGGQSGVVAAEVGMIAANVLRKRLKGSNVDTLLNSTKGSGVATDVASLQAYANDYGIEMSPAQALKYVADGLGQKDYLEKQKERIRQTAIALHPRLKDHIVAGGKVSDITDQFAARQYKKTGKVITDSTKDSNIMSAVSRGITLDEWDRELQGTKEWATGEEANGMVTNFINNLGRMWGRG